MYTGKIGKKYTHTGPGKKIPEKFLSLNTWLISEDLFQYRVILQRLGEVAAFFKYPIFNKYHMTKK